MKFCQFGKKCVKQQSKLKWFQIDVRNRPVLSSLYLSLHQSVDGYVEDEENSDEKVSEGDDEYYDLEKKRTGGGRVS